MKNVHQLYRAPMLVFAMTPCRQNIDLATHLDDHLLNCAIGDVTDVRGMAIVNIDPRQRARGRFIDTYHAGARRMTYDQRVPIRRRSRSIEVSTHDVTS